MKKVTGIFPAPGQHWVGDGFPVRSLFSYSDHGRLLSPFLLLDYAGPTEFEPGQVPRGVGQHPHRGFETVTIVYKGEVDHRDSTGSGGHIGPGDVQWMTAASGIIHEEFHAPDFTRNGGTLEMIQLWVNLPAKDKMSPPRYQALLNQDIPTVELPRDAGSLRVIAGEYHGVAGPAQTFTPIQLWDMKLRAGGKTDFEIAEGDSLALVILSGEVLVNESESVSETDLVILDRAGRAISLRARSDARVLLLSGEPIDEPVVGYGPFVMNSQREISQALSDFNSGRFGQLAD